MASVTVAPAEQRLTLHNISWDTYEKLLDAFGEHWAARITYDAGVLEFMVPLEAHENPSAFLPLQVFPKKSFMNFFNAVGEKERFRQTGR